MKKIISCFALIVLIIACKKTEIPVQPTPETATTSKENHLNNNLTVTTHPVNVTSAISAFIFGEISVAGGGNSIVVQGFCYNTSPGTTINNDTIHGAPYFNTGMFAGLIEGLTPGTTYYVRAFGIKNNGNVYYGNEISFITLTLGLPGPGVGTVTDIDGNVYNTITLGTQVWMVENLKTTHFRNGDPIANITDNTAWTTATTSAYCDYNNDPAISAVYGRLYNQFAASDTRNIAPAGWHVASPSEWFTLLYYLGGGGIAGGRMKEAGFNHWSSPNTGADNSSGFTALGAGFRHASFNGVFLGLQNYNRFWSSVPGGYFSINLQYDSGSFSYASGSCPSCLTYGYSIRCVKN